MCETGPSDEKKAAIALAEKIRGKPGGLKIGDKSRFFRTYISVFSGKDAITWMVGHGQAKNREEAVYKLQVLVDQHLVHHINDQHRIKDNDTIFYRFFEDETAANLKREKEQIRKSFSVTELLSDCHGVTQHGFVDIKGFFGWNTRYMVLRGDEGVLFMFENEISASPKEEINIGEAFIIKEVLDLRKGWYCWTLTGNNSTYTLGTEKSKDQEAWINAFANVGCRFDKEDADTTHKSIFEFKALNIDGTETSLSAYAGNVCVVVNVASQ